MTIHDDMKGLLKDFPLLDTLVVEVNGIHEDLCLHDAIRDYLDKPTPEHITAIREKVSRFYHNHRTNLAHTELLNLMDSYERAAGPFVEGHRLHLDHVFNVWFLGLIMYKHLPDVRDTFQKYYEKSFPEYWEHNMQIVTKEQACFKIFLYEWTMAALFHDVAYPFEVSVRSINRFFQESFIPVWKPPGKGPELMDNMLRFQGTDLSEFLKLYPLENITNEELCNNSLEILAHNISRLVNNNVDKSLEHIKQYMQNGLAETGRIDHWIYSALVFLKGINAAIAATDYSHIEPKDKEALMNYQYAAANIASAIFLHNAYRFHFAGKLGAKMTLDTHPLAYLLYLCDNIQEWNKYESRLAHTRNEKQILQDLEKYRLEIKDEKFLVLTVPVSKRKEKREPVPVSKREEEPKPEEALENVYNIRHYWKIYDLPGDVKKTLQEAIDIGKDSNTIDITVQNNFSLFKERVTGMIDQVKDQDKALHSIITGCACIAKLPDSVNGYEDLFGRLDKVVNCAEKLSKSSHPFYRAFACRLLGELEFYSDYVVKRDEESRKETSGEFKLLTVLISLAKDTRPDVWILAVIAMERLCESKRIKHYLIEDKTTEKCPVVLVAGAEDFVAGGDEQVGWKRRRLLRYAECIQRIGDLSSVDYRRMNFLTLGCNEDETPIESEKKDTALLQSVYSVLPNLICSPLPTVIVTCMIRQLVDSTGDLDGVHIQRIGECFPAIASWKKEEPERHEKAKLLGEILMGEIREKVKRKIEKSSPEKMNSGSLYYEWTCNYEIGRALGMFARYFPKEADGVIKDHVSKKTAQNKSISDFEEAGFLRESVTSLLSPPNDAKDINHKIKSLDELLGTKEGNFFLRLAIVKNLEQTNPGESWQWITGFIENQRHSPLGYCLLQRYAARACLQLKLGKDIP